MSSSSIHKSIGLATIALEELAPHTLKQRNEKSAINSRETGKLEPRPSACQVRSYAVVPDIGNAELRALHS
jgi:hypothetical protein